MTDDELADLGGLPPDVPASWEHGVAAEVVERRAAAIARLEASALTADELWQRRWYAVVDDEVGGYAVATVDRPTSQINPTTTRDRVLLWVTWEQHAQRLVDLHNAALDRQPTCELDCDVCRGDS